MKARSGVYETASSYLALNETLGTTAGWGTMVGGLPRGPAGAAARRVADPAARTDDPATAGRGRRPAAGGSGPPAGVGPVPTCVLPDRPGGNTGRADGASPSTAIKTVNSSAGGMPGPADPCSASRPRRYASTASDSSPTGRGSGSRNPVPKAGSTSSGSTRTPGRGSAHPCCTRRRPAVKADCLRTAEPSSPTTPTWSGGTGSTRRITPSPSTRPTAGRSPFSRRLTSPTHPISTSSSPPTAGGWPSFVSPRGRQRCACSTLRLANSSAS